ncbi:MAG: Gfo/Idh/MocA family oxidoreductase [Opitutales bacterium]|jgi:predicted dehydrogenase|nr:Gfo/Idh/MocA family oxidoreductase [Opitutales bacterium]MBT5814319.1 Gfo/Idh/MocA family oxidoreductase [Opitutales bacterium]MBT6378718.1 Gfo/Idh/MocA family oxidoreductase [Opitutales bacterium]MBT6767515.1 Gfo/Idh/MocA family oxidoreductase [Opitutales bacterium]
MNTRDKDWKIVGINFDHMHMGDLLRQTHEHPSATIAGICDADPTRMEEAIANFSIPENRVFTDIDVCMKTIDPDLVIICAATARHAEYVEKIAPYGKHLFIEKPFADSLASADRMAAAMVPGQQLIINWPLRWYPSHATAYRLINEGLIGTVREVHYYDGNRGPLAHGADKIVKDVTPKLKAESWFYKKSEGGGALLDYLGYGTTLGAWFNGGKSPVDVTTVIGGDPSLEVDEHSITICRYADGTLSKFETKWGTFTDPWTHQPQPKCGFNIIGSEGTIASYDLEPTIRIQTQEKPEGETIPCDELVHPFHAPIPYVLHRIENGLEIDGPLSPEVARIGQQIVDAAVLSASERSTVSL